MDEAIETYRANARRESAELDIVKAALGKEFPQKNELTLTRENHAAIIRELQSMQDEPGFVSSREPKTALTVDPPPMAVTTRAVECGDVAAHSAEPEEKRFHKVSEAGHATAHTLKFEDGEGRTEYAVSNQHNGHIQDLHILRRVYYSGHVGSIGQSFYEDGRWHTTTTARAA